MSVEALLARLTHVRPSGKDRWRAQCPIHDGGKDALSIKQDGDTILLHCFSCEGGAVAICEAIGLDISEIMPPRVDPYNPRKPAAKSWPARHVLETLHMDLRVAYAIYVNIAKGIPVDMTPERAQQAKERIGRIISELDRAY